MPSITIDSFDDPRIDPYRSLKSEVPLRRQKFFIAEGEKLARRLLASDYEVESLLVSHKIAHDFDSESTRIPIYVIPDGWVEGIVGYNFHRGVLACGRRKTLPTVDQICARIGEYATLVVCPDVQDPENLGSIFRLASAFGVDAVLLGNHTADPLSRRVLRVSMGAVLRMPYVLTTDIAAAVRHLGGQGFARWATVLDREAEPLTEMFVPPKLALLFGSEGHGLDRSLVDLCDRRVTIPISGEVDSLNVSIAAGIFLNHVAHLGNPKRSSRPCADAKSATKS